MIFIGLNFIFRMSFILHNHVSEHYFRTRTHLLNGVFRKQYCSERCKKCDPSPRPTVINNIAMKFLYLNYKYRRNNLRTNVVCFSRNILYYLNIWKQFSRTHTQNAFNQVNYWKSVLIVYSIYYFLTWS